MDINSLNTMNFDVIPFFAIKNLSTDTSFNSLTEYLEMSNFLQRKAYANSQIQLMWVKDNTLYGNCEKSQLKGEFQKSFCFRFLSAIFAGGNDFKYNIDGVLNKLDRLDNQFGNLKKFVEYANTSILKPIASILIDFDGGYGYPTSFLEEAFGGLVRVTKDRNILSIFSFKSDEEPSLIKEVESYIKAAIEALK